MALTHLYQKKNLSQDFALIPNPRTKWDPNPTLTLTISPLCLRKCLSRGMQTEPNPTLTLTISPLCFRKLLSRGMQSDPNPTLTKTISPLFFRKLVARACVHVLARTAPQPRVTFKYFVSRSPTPHPKNKNFSAALRNFYFWGVGWDCSKQNI